jgi:L-ribulose-5-phosphate 4-epimerase
VKRKTESSELARLREEVYRANMALPERGLVTATFGNVSGIDRDRGIVIIKPSGVAYDQLSPDNLVAVNLEGRVVSGELNPSSDTPTHLGLYRGFPAIGAVVHTHSRCATAWAQARRPLPCLGTTHADTFHGEVPCTELIRDEQIAGDYEAETAALILETFAARDYRVIPGVLVAAHGPFTWGKTPEEAVYHSQILEYITELVILTLSINPDADALKQSLLDRHYLRKHGGRAYYGQNRKREE